MNPINLSAVLTLEEFAALKQVNLDPNQFVVVTTAASGMQLNGPFSDPNTGKQAFMAILHCAIPLELLNIPVSRLKDAQGQDLTGQRLQQAAAGAQLRIILRRDVLSNEAQAQLLRELTGPDPRAPGKLPLPEE